MGWAAADEFYRANRSWLGSTSDAYDALYGDDGMSNSAKKRCPICGKKCSRPENALRHALAVHTNPKFAARIADFAELVSSAKPAQRGE